jgi:hypothetical protein
MRFFRRDRDASGAAAADAFWTWWASSRDRVAAAIADGTVGSLVGEISDRVRRLDPHLAWELAPGATARHALIVTPEGNAERRPKAVAWLAGAPPVDAVWEYHASRQPGPLHTVVIGSSTVDFEAFRAIAGWDETRERLDVRLWHPALVSLPEAMQHQAAFLFLDNLLGEDDVERWIGSIDILAAETGGRTPAELRDEVARRAAAATHEVWVVAERRDRHGDLAVVSANAAVKRVDLPFALTHLCVSLDRGLEELADSPELPDLDAAEARLVEQVEAAEGTFIGRITDRRQRRLHFACEDAGRAKDTAQAWAHDEPRYGARVDVRADPHWDFMRDLLG